VSGPVYTLENVSRSYGGRPALSLDRLEIADGVITGIAGPNGSGKSTLLRLLAFLEEPDTGRIFFDGKSSNGRFSELRRQVTLLPQEPYLLRRTVEENVGYGLKVRHAPAARSAINDALILVGLDPAHFLKRQWYELSGGEAQRVAMAARLALSPRVLLLDEPTAGLDEASCEQVALILGKASQRGLTCVVVSHDREWLVPLAGRMLHMRHGSLCP
jgi:tungstate transport system ATP-binding protein